jgi:hypothetical protein
LLLSWVLFPLVLALLGAGWGLLVRGLLRMVFAQMMALSQHSACFL